MLRSFFRTVRLLSLPMIALATTAPIAAQTTVFGDGFDSFALGNRWGVSPGLALPGGLTTTTIDGASVLRITSILSDFQSVGFASTAAVQASLFRCEVDFKTMPRFDVAVPAANQENIDGLLTISLIDAATWSHINIGFFGGFYGDLRQVILHDTTLGSFAAPAWEYDTWYRFVIEGTPTGCGTQLC